MCGLLGAFLYADAIGDPAPFIRATQRLRHRGPDDGTWWSEGGVFLGHRRLSIIDLDGGAQPLATANGRYLLIFNGEIYNFRELRAELKADGYRFRTESDSEVALAGLSRHGAEFCVRMEGMFALALVDRTARTLLLARDRFGEKPLYIAETERGVYFASEMRPLVAFPGVDGAPDRHGVADFLCLNYTAGERTLINGIRRLAPGTWAQYGPSGLSGAERYWSWPGFDTEAPISDEEEALQALSSAMDSALPKTMRSDVPVSVALSGGLDSSAVAIKASQHKIVDRAYCLDFPDEGFSEFPKATRVAERLGLPLERVDIRPADITRFMEQSLSVGDPMADSSGAAVSTLARAVSGHHKVLVGGDGGDELFAGYLTYRASQLHKSFIAPLPDGVRTLLARLSAAVPRGSGKVTKGYKLWRFLRAASYPTLQAHLTWNGAWLPDEARRLTGNADGRNVLRDIVSGFDEGAVDTLPVLQSIDAGNYLPNDILAKVDTATMAHGVECRSPLLMPEIASVAARIAPQLRTDKQGRGKRVLRSFVRRHLGDDIADAPKEGFSIPVHAWIRGDGREIAEETLCGAAAGSLGILDTAEVRRALDAHLQGRADYGFELWGMMTMTGWLASLSRTPVDVAVSDMRNVSLQDMGADSGG